MQMVSTGRGLDRLIILLLIMACLVHFVYNQWQQKQTSKLLSSKDKSFTERIQDLTDQVNETRTTVMEWTTPKSEDDESSVELPSPVATGFLS